MTCLYLNRWQKHGHVRKYCYWYLWTFRLLTTQVWEIWCRQRWHWYEGQNWMSGWWKPCTKVHRTKERVVVVLRYRISFTITSVWGKDVHPVHNCPSSWWRKSSGIGEKQMSWTSIVLVGRYKARDESYYVKVYRSWPFLGNKSELIWAKHQYRAYSVMHTYKLHWIVFVISYLVTSVRCPIIAAKTDESGRCKPFAVYHWHASSIGLFIGEGIYSTSIFKTGVSRAEHDWSPTRDPAYRLSFWNILWRKGGYA